MGRQPFERAVQVCEFPGAVLYDEIHVVNVELSVTMRCQGSISRAAAARRLKEDESGLINTKYRIAGGGKFSFRLEELAVEAVCNGITLIIRAGEAFNLDRPNLNTACRFDRDLAGKSVGRFGPQLDLGWNCLRAGLVKKRYGTPLAQDVASRRRVFIVDDIAADKLDRALTLQTKAAAPSGVYASCRSCRSDLATGCSRRGSVIPPGFRDFATFMDELVWIRYVDRAGIFFPLNVTYATVCMLMRPTECA